ncbi:trehalose-phosphatase [Acidiferrobacter sp.]|uniref:trehalose-phosphatase n=1 Tax=Acidiferrobacter sp. TaxID=1872107 RepID=UPI00260661A8|nr:trehalose-phosphatase [Acidiferrobacter sp.]
MRILDPARPPARFFAALRRAHDRLLVLDYDGTLAPFTERREDAVFYVGVAPLLAAIARQGTKIAFVSGRPAEDLAARIPLKGVEVFGAHGLEHITPSGDLTRASLPASVQRWLDTGAERIAAAGFPWALERKHGALAIHWRGAHPDAHRGLKELACDMARGIPEPIQGLAFDGGFEFRARGRDKGTAIADLIARHPRSAMAYLGDDMTDEDAFAALPQAGLGVLVAAAPRATHAQLWLRPPDELRAFLTSWLAAATP